MRMIAQLQGVPENDNGRTTLAAPAPGSRDDARVIPAAAHNDGPVAVVETLVLFLPAEAPARPGEGSDAEVTRAVVVLPILRAANDDETAPDAEALLAADPEFAMILDDARARWTDWMDAKSQTEGPEPDAVADESAAAVEGDDDDDFA